MTVYLQFDRIKTPVALVVCDQLPQLIKQIMPAWPISIVNKPGGYSPLITICKTNAGYERYSPWLEKPKIVASPVDAVCDLIVDLTKALVADNPGVLCLHCAAVEISGRVIAFPSAYRSGKSLLTVYLAALGARVLSDDVLLLNRANGTVSALGILPRLRLPLPDRTKDDFIEYVAHHRGPFSADYHYVDPGPDRLAPYNVAMTITDIVSLERADHYETELSSASKGDILRLLILRNFARDLAGTDILEILGDVVDASNGYSLRYRNIAQAAPRLFDHFRAGHMVQEP